MLGLTSWSLLLAAALLAGAPDPFSSAAALDTTVQVSPQAAPAAAPAPAPAIAPANQTPVAAKPEDPKNAPKESSRMTAPGNNGSIAFTALKPNLPPCENDASCAGTVGPNSFCNEHWCECQPGATYDASFSKKCLLSRNVIGEQCTLDGDCKVQNSYCKAGQCHCSRSFTFNVDKTKCLPMATKEDPSCEVALQCVVYLNSSAGADGAATCKDGRCLCRYDYEFVDGNCLKKRAPNGGLTESTHSTPKIQGLHKRRKRLITKSRVGTPKEIDELSKTSQGYLMLLKRYEGSGLPEHSLQGAHMPTSWKTFHTRVMREVMERKLIKRSVKQGLTKESDEGGKAALEAEAREEESAGTPGEAESSTASTLSLDMQTQASNQALEGATPSESPAEAPPQVPPAETAEAAPPAEALAEAPPAEAPAEAPLTDAPTDAPAEAPPAEAPTEAPPAEAPAESPPAEAPAEAPPAEAPAEAPPAEAPVQTPPAEAPVEAPTAEAPAEAPPTAAAVEAPPADTPADAPPAEVPAESPPAEAPAETPPAEAPVEVPPAEAPTEAPPAEAPVEATNAQTPQPETSVDSTSAAAPAETESVTAPKEEPMQGDQPPADASPVKSPGRGDSCKTDDECKDLENAACIQGICACKENFVPAADAINKCLSVVTALSGACSEHIQCSRGLGDLAVCERGVCACVDGGVLNGEKCECAPGLVATKGPEPTKDKLRCEKPAPVKQSAVQQGVQGAEQGQGSATVVGPSALLATLTVSLCAQLIV